MVAIEVLLVWITTQSKLEP